MAIQTIDLRQMHEKKLNVYEACLLISARARQINSERLEEKKENEKWTGRGRQSFETRNQKEDRLVRVRRGAFGCVKARGPLADE